jgi:hypothetical protein
MESTDITEFISILRKPKIRIIDKNIALFDVSATLIAGYYISEYFEIPIYIGIPSTFMVGHLTHKALGVKTQFS